MKRFLTIISLILAGYTSSRAQIASVITSFSGNHAPAHGRDFWVCFPQNDAVNQQQSKEYHIYVTSDRDTKVHFELAGPNGITTSLLTKNTVIDFQANTNFQNISNFSVGKEITSSGAIESDKAIHVWSDDADLSVCTFSAVPFSADGMYVIPTTGWGSEYVVGSYVGVFDQGGTEWPSEFAIIASRDSTHVTITPSWDIRMNGKPGFAAFPKGQLFSVTLNKGDCIQYQATAIDPNEDLTGTTISSDKPIGVLGASAGPYIPAPWVNPGSPDQSCCGDYVLEMMQPVSSWSNSYFTLPFANRKYSGDLFLVAGTKKSQKIFQNGKLVAALADSMNHPFMYLLDVHGASHWTSDTSFMLVQYMEGGWWDEQHIERPNPTKPNDQRGDPCSVAINPTDQFAKKIIFQIPYLDPAKTIVSNFNTYVNIILPSREQPATSFDGVNLGAAGTTTFTIPNVLTSKIFPIDSTGWEGIQLQFGAGEGAHEVISDTGVGVYVYGQAQDESYAWSGHLGTRILHSSDTIPPLAVVSGKCSCAHVALSDRGALQTKLSEIALDSTFNMTFFADSSFVAGADSSYYDLCVADSLKEGYASVNIYDAAGNMTRVVTTYKPEMLRFSPAPLDFGVVNSGSALELYDTLFNAGETPVALSLSQIKLRSGKKGFIIDSIVNGTIPAAGNQRIKISFTPVNTSVAEDTIVFTRSCRDITAILIGNNVNNYVAGDFNFGCIDTGTSKKLPVAILKNLGSERVTITRVTIDDTVHFSFNGILPDTINAGAGASYDFTFMAKEIGNDTTIVHFQSPEAGERIATLIGCGQVHASVEERGYASALSPGSEEYEVVARELKQAPLSLLPPVPNPASKKGALHFIYGLKGQSAVDLSLFDILGNHIATVIHSDGLPSGIYATSFPLLPRIPAGEYLYRLAGAGMIISGTLLLIEN